MKIDQVLIPVDNSDLACRGIAPGVAVARAVGCPAMLYSQVADIEQVWAHEQHLTSLAGQIADVDINVWVGHGASPAEGIEAMAGETPGTLVYMSTHGRAASAHRCWEMLPNRCWRDSIDQSCWSAPRQTSMAPRSMAR